MPTSVLLPNLGRDIPTEFARRVEAYGYDTLWTGELWGMDAFVLLTHLAEHTDDLGLGTAIVNAFSRSPAALAQAAVSLDRVSDGRFRLGVGTSTEKAIDDLHGVPFERPVRRLHETVELTRAFMDGTGRVTYEGELFQVADFPALDHPVPVYSAALGPASRRATGRVSDGWMPHMLPFEELPEAFETVAETARERGRDPDDLVVAPYVPSAVSDDPDEARAAIRGHVAYYVGSGAGYRRTVGRTFPDAAERVADAWRAGDRGEARAAVTDEMVDTLGVAGTPETARERFRAVKEVSVVDEPIVVVPNGSSEELTERTVAELAPDAS